MDKKIKVLHVLGPLRPSGMERMLIPAIKEWERNGVLCEVAGMGDHHPFAKTLSSAGYQVYEYGDFKSRSLVDLILLVRRNNYQVVHLHAERTFAIVATLVALLTRARVVRTIHSCFEPRGYQKLTRKLFFKLASLVGTRFVACSQDVADNERLLNGIQPTVVENWIDLDSMKQCDHLTKTEARIASGLPANGKMALLLGNCSDAKNHEGVLSAEMPDYLTIVHVGNTHDATDDELRYLSGDQVLDLGSREDVNVILRAVDMMIVPSRREGMSIALLEGLAADLPIIASDVKGLQVAKDFFGTIALPVECFATRLPHAIIQLSALTAPQRSNARERFSPATGVRKYSNEYKKAL